MGALKSGAFPVELNGKEYGLLFSLNALDEVQEKFGGYDKLSEVFNKDNPNLFKDTRWLLTLLINEALLAEDENAQLLEEKRVGRLIHAGNLQEVQNAIFKSFYRGTAGDNSDTENENDGEENNRRGKQGSRAGKLDTARLLYIAVVLLRYREREAWRKTPYQITTLFKYHKEYNPHIFRQEQAGTPAATENMDDIDIALGAFNYGR
ncbi:MAG: hypothetical protein ACLTH3_14785 [Lachnospira sp.]